MEHPDDTPFGVLPAEVGGTRLIDVRRAPTYAQASGVIAGATWQDPARVDHWGTTLARGEPVVVYCVHGHEVSQTAAARLRAGGVDARHLVGGIEAWKAAGLPLHPRPADDGGTP